MSDESKVRFSLITGKGHLIVFDSSKDDVAREIRTSYNSTLSTEDVESFGDLVKDCVALVKKVL